MRSLLIIFVVWTAVVLCLAASVAYPITELGPASEVLILDELSTDVRCQVVATTVPLPQGQPPHIQRYLVCFQFSQPLTIVPIPTNKED